MGATLQEVDVLPDGYDSATPLVLIHDGGGTVFQYYMLGSLQRRTYAIASPYFDDGTRPQGGIPQLAAEYVEAIRDTLQKGPIILGGWSFGGLVSVEMARILENDPHLQIKGLLLIDSFCPWSKAAQARPRVKPVFQDRTSAQMREKVTRSFDNATDMSRSWSQPQTFTSPPAVVIRATESIFTGDAELPSNQDPTLGWAEFDSLKILSVIGVPGNHFSMFEVSRLDNLTEKISEGCLMLS